MEETSVTVWLEEIKTAKKREKDFHENGEKIIKLYEADKETPFNILYSNTETMLPALFSDMPRPVIQRRFRDEDPMAKAASQAAQRMLEYLLDTDLEGYDKFADSIENAVLDGLLPGRGVTSIKYEADITETDDEDDIPTINYETICTDARVWNRVYFGYAKKWSKVPWIAFEDHLDEEECEKLFGEEVTDKITFTEGEEDDEERTENENRGKRKTALIYQIWDKSDRTIKYITPQYKDDFLKTQEDPLGLTGFFNIPEPIQFIKKSSNLTPTSPYKMYENQAEELNRIQRRLNRVIESIKARGCYDGALGEEIANILKEDDNALVPTDQGATIATQGGLDKAIWMLPIEKLIVVAQQLIQARESAKRVIYEITGISDIIRGQSMASETLGAQQIKQAWGTMRLKRLQKRVQKYVLDSMTIMLEIAISKLSEETWKKMTNLPFPTADEKAKAQQMLQLMQQQQMQQMGPPQPGQQPPKPDPKLVQAAQLPSWSEILKLLKTDRSFRIDIETNSTLDVEATEDKQIVSEFMNAFAQFLNGVSPLVQQGALDFEVAKSMMLAIVRRYRFGREVEDQLKTMKPPQQGGQEAQQLAKEKQKFDQERNKAGQELDKQFNDLNVQKAKFEFEKQLDQLKRKHEEDLIQARQQIREEKAKADFQSMLDKSALKIQSMLDKQAARLQRQAG